MHYRSQHGAATAQYIVVSDHMDVRPPALDKIYHAVGSVQDMSASEDHIICRQCGEHVSMTVGSCPKCGAEIRGRKTPLAALVVGVALVGVALTDPGQFWLFGLIGAFVGFGGAFFLYDRRKRIEDATPS